MYLSKHFSCKIRCFAVYLYLLQGRSLVFCLNKHKCRQRYTYIIKHCNTKQPPPQCVSNKVIHPSNRRLDLRRFRRKMTKQKCLLEGATHLKCVYEVMGMHSVKRGQCAHGIGGSFGYQSKSSNTYVIY